MSKGSAPRPIPDRETYESNYDAIFGKKIKEDVVLVPSIISIGSKVQDGDYSKWRVGLMYSGKEYSGWFYYGGLGEYMDTPPEYQNLRSKARKTIHELIRKEMDVKQTQEMELLADEIVNKVLHDKIRNRV